MWVGDEFTFYALLNRKVQASHRLTCLTPKAKTVIYQLKISNTILIGSLNHGL